MEIDIKKIAKLSRLAIEPEREEKFQKDMQNIIEMVERLPEMETGDLSPNGRRHHDASGGCGGTFSAAG